MDIYCVTLLDARTPEIKVWGGLAPSKASRENAFQAPPPASGGTGILGLPWLEEASPNLFMFTWGACLCSNFPFPKDTSHVGLGLTLPQCDLVLTNYSCKDPISKYSHILRYWVFKLQHKFEGTQSSPGHPVGKAPWCSLTIARAGYSASQTLAVRGFGEATRAGHPGAVRPLPREWAWPPDKEDTWTTNPKPSAVVGGGYLLIRFCLFAY